MERVSAADVKAGDVVELSVSTDTRTLQPKYRYTRNEVLENPLLVQLAVRMRFLVREFVGLCSG